MGSFKRLVQTTGRCHLLPAADSSLLTAAFLYNTIIFAFSFQANKLHLCLFTMQCQPYSAVQCAHCQQSLNSAQHCKQQRIAQQQSQAHRRRNSMLFGATFCLLINSALRSLFFNTLSSLHLKVLILNVLIVEFGSSILNSTVQSLLGKPASSSPGRCDNIFVYMPSGRPQYKNKGLWNGFYLLDSFQTFPMYFF